MLNSTNIDTQIESWKKNLIVHLADWVGKIIRMFWSNPWHKSENFELMIYKDWNSVYTRVSSFNAFITCNYYYFVYNLYFFFEN